MFNSESKNISTCTMWRELKGLGLNSCVAWRKTLISEANRKNSFSLSESINIGLWSNGRRSCGLSPDLPRSRVMVLQGKKRGGWSDAYIMHSDVSHVINTGSWRSIHATLDGNKCCDIAEAYRNDATANACLKAVQWNIRVCDLFFGRTVYTYRSETYLNIATFLFQTRMIMFFKKFVNM